MRAWPARRWGVSIVSAVLTVLVVGIPTVLIPSPWFGRTVPPTWWSWPALLITASLSGLLTATYVRVGATAAADHPSRSGLLGGFLTYLAVGCPVCNKVALLALGSAGAMQWFAPVQPVLALSGIALLGYALRRRLAGERACPVPTVSAPGLGVR